LKSAVGPKKGRARAPGPARSASDTRPLGLECAPRTRTHAIRCEAAGVRVWFGNVRRPLFRPDFVDRSRLFLLLRGRAIEAAHRSRALYMAREPRYCISAALIGGARTLTSAATSRAHSGAPRTARDPDEAARSGAGTRPS